MSVKSRVIKFAAKVGKRALKNNKRFKKLMGKGFGRKAMSSAQKVALRKAVKASALARRKSIRAAGKRLFTRKAKKVTYYANKPLSMLQARKFVGKYTNPKDFTTRVVNGKTLTPKVQAKAFRKVMYASIKDNNNILKMHRKAHRQAARLSAKAAKAASGGSSIDWKSSVLWSVGLTAALNPSYTAEKLKEAKDAVKRKIS